eukprot:10082938-Karenia_brevis.AAC.1
MLYCNDMHIKSASVWQSLEEDLQKGSADQDLSDVCISVLRADLGLGPFASLLVARNLSLILDPRLYDWDRRDLGQFAKMGLYILAGLDVQSARVSSQKKQYNPRAQRLFQLLLDDLPKALQVKDEDGIIE